MEKDPKDPRRAPKNFRKKIFWKKNRKMTPKTPPGTPKTKATKAVPMFNYELSLLFHFDLQYSLFRVSTHQL